MKKKFLLLFAVSSGRFWTEHAEETIIRDITLITAASKDLEAARYVQELFSNHYFRLYTNTDVIGVETAGALKNIIAVGAGALHGLVMGTMLKQPSSRAVSLKSRAWR